MLHHASHPFAGYTPPSDIKIAIIGLGYVGLPLAVEFARQFQVTGFDTNAKRIQELQSGFDRTLEIESHTLSEVLRPKEGVGLSLGMAVIDIARCNIYIVAVPTPTDVHNRPDLALLRAATQTVAGVLKPGDIVIYESTVYPGATEEYCVPLLESLSGLKFNHDFFAGYSPERINPGDKVHTLTNIVKVTSGSTPEVANFVDRLYQRIVTAGTHKAPSIKVAEACKVIENTQRDVNIAFVNELAKIFNLLNIDSNAVWEAAGTKWNFLNFRPGLVGGHCTGVDPYYLAQRAQQAGYHPEIILAGRRLNDGMGTYIALEVIKLMVKRDIAVKKSRVLVLGFTFKENCPDVRNTRVIDILKVLQEFEVDYRVYDPWANADEVLNEYNISLCDTETCLHEPYDAVIMAVAHQQFKVLDYNKLRRTPQSVVYDVKGMLDQEVIDGRL